MKLAFPKANRGRALEATIIASQSDSRGPVLCLDKFPTSSRRIPGGKIVQAKSPVDFIGTVLGSGRMVCFDAKQSGKDRFYPSVVPDHQVLWLIRHGRAGALAGLLVESTKAQRFYWLKWQVFQFGAKIVACPWSDPLLINLGDSKHCIQFRRLIESREGTP